MCPEVGTRDRKTRVRKDAQRVRNFRGYWSVCVGIKQTNNRERSALIILRQAKIELAVEMNSRLILLFTLKNSNAKARSERTRSHETRAKNERVAETCARAGMRSQMRNKS